MKEILTRWTGKDERSRRIKDFKKQEPEVKQEIDSLLSSAFQTPNTTRITLTEPFELSWREKMPISFEMTPILQDDILSDITLVNDHDGSYYYILFNFKEEGSYDVNRLEFKYKPDQLSCEIVTTHKANGIKKEQTEKSLDPDVQALRLNRLKEGLRFIISEEQSRGKTDSRQ